MKDTNIENLILFKSDKLCFLLPIDQHDLKTPTKDKEYVQLFVCVTNFYLGSIPVTNELHQVSKGSKSHLISGGDSSCSWC